MKKAIEHQTGKVLAYVFGRRKDDVFLKLKALLEPFSRDITPTIGALIHGILMRMSMSQASATHRRLSVNT